jgi:hypothetical protein
MAVDLVTHALTTLANVKEALTIPTATTDKDDLIKSIINAVTELIEGWCRRRFLSTTYTDELYDGDDSYILFLEHYPIISVTSLYVNDVLQTVRTETLGPGYVIYLKEGKIEHDMAFSGGRQNIKITYVAGWAAIPNDVEMAARMQASRVFQLINKKELDIASRSLADGSIQLMRKEFLPEVEIMLKKYKVMIIC